MTTPDPTFMLDAEAVWGLKENGVAEIDDDFDITPTITFFRDGRKIAAFMAMRVNKHDAIAAVHIGSSMLDADAVVVSMDTHISHVQNNPATGKPWEPGEMQKACNDHGACDTGIITDAILTLRVGKDIPTENVSRKYHVNHAKRQVHWVDPWEHFVEDADRKMSGFVFDSMKNAFNERRLPPMCEIEPPEGLTDPEEEIRVHKNVAALRLLGCVVGGGIVAFEGGEKYNSIYEEYLTPEYIQKDMDNPLLGRLMVPLLREKFHLDD